MTGIHKYRNIYVIVGIIFGVIITQSSLDDRTQRMVLLAYIVLGSLVTEFVGRTILKKKGHEKTEVKGINMSWNIYVLVGIIFAIIITQSSLSAGTQVTLLLAYIVLGSLVTEFVGRTILKKKGHEKTEVKGINMSWNIYVLVAIVFALTITQSSFSAGTQVTLLFAYIVLGFLVTEFIVRTILKKQSY